jgi:uncharacterized protein
MQSMKTYHFLLLIIAICACDDNDRKKISWRPKILDRAELFPKSGEDSLADVIRKIKKETGADLGIYTARHLDQESIEEMSLEKAKGIGIGRASHDDGILIVIVEEEKTIRIEVGYGLENILRDEIASRYNRQIIAPHFSHGKFSRGLYLAAEQILQLLKANKARIGERPEYLQRWDSISAAHKKSKVK